MFFLLGRALERFRHLNIGLAFVLIFVGAKLMISAVYQLPIALSLAVIVILPAASILSSLWSQRERGAETV